MELASLVVNKFRNFDSFKLDLGAGLNFIFGKNGTGKTSLLEAVYYLSRGKSFRTHVLTNLIAHDAAEFILHAELVNDEVVLPVGLQKSMDGSKLLRINGEETKSFIELTNMLPVLLLDTDSHRQLASGPKYRRSILDWGCFYHFSEFAKLWRDYNRVLAQRNLALKSQQNLTHWDILLVDLGEKLNIFRQEYLSQLIPIFNMFWQNAAVNLSPIDLGLSSGWLGDDFAAALTGSLELDKRLGFTKVGPHRADLMFTIKSGSVFNILSQGQQKSLSYTLSLAQGKLLQDKLAIPCVYLVDDLTAELDVERRGLLLDNLLQLDSQVILTMIEQDSLVANYGNANLIYL